MTVDNSRALVARLRAMLLLLLLLPPPVPDILITTPTLAALQARATEAAAAVGRSWQPMTACVCVCE